MKLIQSVERAFMLLEILDCCDEMEGMGVLELAKQAGLKGPTTHNFLQTLIAQGYVEQGEKGKYRLANRSRWLGWGWNRRFQLLHSAHAHASRLSLLLDETVIMTARIGRYWQTVFKIECSRDLTTKLGLSMTDNFYISATGRCILSTLNDADLRQLVADFRLPRGEEWPGVTDLETMRKHLERIRYDKYELHETGNGISGIGVVIPPREGSAPAALGIIVPTFRVKGEHRQAILDNAIATAAKIAGLETRP